jgi:hypothetical protein
LADHAGDGALVRGSGTRGLVEKSPQESGAALGRHSGGLGILNKIRYKRSGIQCV